MRSIDSVTNNTPLLKVSNDRRNALAALFTLFPNMRFITRKRGAMTRTTRNSLQLSQISTADSDPPASSDGSIFVTIALLIIWLSLAVAYFSIYPVGFYVTTLAFGLYVATRVTRALRAR